MKLNVVKKDLSLTSVKHQAICKEDGFSGPQRDSIIDAYKDAKAYRDIPGNENKVIEVITTQTMSVISFK